MSDKHTLVWSETLKDVHSHSANKSAGALIETPVSILQIAAIGSCVRDLVPLPYLGNQYTAECTGRTVHPDWKNIYNVCEDFENLQAIFCWYFFNCMFMPRKDVGSKILSFVMIDYLEMQSLDN